MGTDPLFLEYRRCYWLLQRALSECELISRAASLVLADFPNGSLSSVHPTLDTDIDALAQLLDSAPRDERGYKKIETTCFKGLSAAAIHLILAHAKLGETDRFDVERTALAQELALTIAHLDAFIADSVKYICLQEPRVLKQEKKVSWSQVLDFKSIEEAQNYLIDQYSMDLGMRPIRDRYDHLARQHHLNLPQLGEDLCEIHEAELLRNVILHNGGRASHEYLRQTSRTDVPFGGIIPLSREYVSSVQKEVVRAADALFIAVAVKFFGLEQNSLDICAESDQPI